MARRFPIRLLESGPAGSGLAAALFGRSAGKDNVISFDMGGTTAKACLAQEGRIDVAPMTEAARVHRFKRGSGLPIKAPVIDMIEIGAPAQRGSAGTLRRERAQLDPGPRRSPCAGRRQ
jgi:5-oxoprolinase (ATP-hydrolysing)